MVFSGTATCQSDKEMGRLLSVLEKYHIDPDIYGRRVLVEYVTKDDAAIKELLAAFESVSIHGTCITRERR